MCCTRRTGSRKPAHSRKAGWRLYPRLNYTSGDFFGPELYQVALRGNQPVGGGLFRGTLFLRRNEFEQFNGNVPPPNTDAFTTNASKGGVAEWTRAILVGVPVGFTVGVDYQRDSVRVEFNNVGGGKPDSTTTIADISPQENIAFYTQAVLSATPKMNITAGLRFDHVKIPYRDRLNSANDSVNTYDEVSPEIGVVYRFTSALKGYLAYKHGFRAPSPLELACASPEAPCSLGAALGADPHLEPVVTQSYRGRFRCGDAEPRFNRHRRFLYRRCERHPFCITQPDAGLLHQCAKDPSAGCRGGRDVAAWKHRPGVWLLQPHSGDLPKHRTDRHD